MAQFRLNVNGDYSSVIEEDVARQIDLLKKDSYSYHHILNNKSYDIKLIGYNINKKTVQLMMLGKEFTVSIEDSFDILAKDLGFSAVANKKIKDLKSPMPGLVLELLVSAGDKVEEGQALLILEAMKMENVIKSPVDGIIKEVHVSQKNAIEKSQLLIEFE